MTEPVNDEGETAAGWIARLSRELGAGGMSPSMQAQVLDIARDVAHGAERKYAPLAAFVAGRHVEARTRDGADGGAALHEVADAVRRVLADRGSTT